MRRLGYPAVIPLFGLVVALGLFSCNPRRSGLGPTAASSVNGPLGGELPAAKKDVVFNFTDQAAAAGISFRHIDGSTPMHYAIETMGGGVAWIDYDQDGFMDLFLVQGSQFPPTDIQPQKPTSRLFHNQGDGTFVDVTEKMGLLHPGYGQGVAVGDYDNDGFPDLFLTCYGHCHLFHNESDGHGGRRFRDVTRAAGVELDGWCTSCAFGDIHGKGYLDLFVCRYVTLDLDHYPFCGDQAREPPLRYSCGPREFRGTSSVLFRNNGDGTFTNVSREAGLETEGKGLGVVILDLDGDGKSDIFVGNDEIVNHYYHNQGGGKLKSCGVTSGIAATGRGNTMGSMGVDADDVTGHGKPDLFITTYYHEGTTLYRNDGENFFTDISPSAGMFAASWDKVGWGTGFCDLDRDGNLDLFVANGHVYRNASEVRAISEDGSANTFAQPAQLFRGNGQGSFLEVSQEAGAYFQVPHVGRGVALGDYDNDGAMDIAINQSGEAPALLHNETRTPYHWIRLQLEGSRHRDVHGANRDAIGSCVTLKAGGRTLVRHVKGGGSYLSAPDRRLLVGLGQAERVDQIEVRWPNSSADVQHFGPLAADCGYRLLEGEAAPLPLLKSRVRVSAPLP